MECQVTDEDGLVDYVKIPELPQFVEFEEAVCELQGADISTMSDALKTVRCCLFLILFVPSLVVP